MDLIGLDQKFTHGVWNGLDRSAGYIIQSSPGRFGLNSIRNLPTDSGLDWIGKCAMCIPYLESWGSFSLSWPWCLQFYPQIFSYIPSFVLKCGFYKVFGRFLLCCVWIGLDWIQFLGHQLDWTGMYPWLWKLFVSCHCVCERQRQCKLRYPTSFKHR